MARKDVSKREAKKPKKSVKRNVAETPNSISPQVEVVRRRRKGREEKE